MNTFQDMRQKLLDLYMESLEKYPLTEDDYVLDLRSQLDGEDTATLRNQYIYDEIKNMPADEQEDLLSLLVIYYYATVIAARKEEQEDIDCSDDEEQDESVEDIDDKLLDLIRDKGKDYVIEELLSDENTYLIDMLSLIIANDVETLSSITQKEGKIEDFEEYAMIDDLIDIDKEAAATDEDEQELFSTKDESVQKVYEKFHPNKEAELKNHKEYSYNDSIMDKTNGMCAKNLADFIEKVSFVKRLYTKKRYYETFLCNILTNTKVVDKELYEKVYLFVIRYCYIKGMFEHRNNKEELKKYKQMVEGAISYMPTTTLDMIYDFVDFDLYSMIIAENMLSTEQKKELEKTVSLDYRKTYGIEGKWVPYTEEQKELINKYCYGWKSKITSNLEKDNHIQIYYSVNENDCYAIPRLCVIYNDANEVIDILGRDIDNLVEYDMLKTLEVYIRKYGNFENMSLDINLLNRLRKIEKKNDSEEELTKEEIDFLFEIECEFPSTLLFHRDIRNKKIQAKTNMKKLFAKYFNCTEDEVAEHYGELNENTKVTLFGITLDGETLPYPNLKAVYGDILAENMTSSEPLKNIEYVKVGLFAPKLKDKEYLQGQVLSKLNIDEDRKIKRK